MRGRAEIQSRQFRDGFIDLIVLQFLLLGHIV
jgi:hypothetical protein